MGSETELKFQVSPQDLKKLRVVRQLRPPDDEPKKSENLLSQSISILPSAGLEGKESPSEYGTSETTGCRRSRPRPQAFPLAVASGNIESTVMCLICDWREARRLHRFGTKISVRNWFPSSRPMYTAPHVLFENA